LNHFEGKPPIAGRYEIREHIATGGMASVYKTWDHRVERIVAIKVLRSLDKNDLRAVERFRREARAAAALTHPNAVTIFDFVEEWGQYFLVMEYINGPTLKQLIGQSRQLPSLQAIEIAAQVCDVLEVAHARGFIHRDIKPQNIMLAWGGGSANGSLNGERPLVKLTDFGIMKTLEKEPVDRFHSAAEMQLALRLCAKELTRANQSNRANMATIRGTDGRYSATVQPVDFVVPDSPPSKRGQFSS
jgi:serine/threonine-protein kinase